MGVDSRGASIGEDDAVRAARVLRGGGVVAPAGEGEDHGAHQQERPHCAPDRRPDDDGCPIHRQLGAGAAEPGNRSKIDRTGGHRGVPSNYRRGRVVRHKSGVRQNRQSSGINIPPPLSSAQANERGEVGGGGGSRGVGDGAGGVVVDKGRGVGGGGGDDGEGPRAQVALGAGWIWEMGQTRGVDVGGGVRTPTKT